MKPGIPWSVKGIESETREAAKAAARRSGLTIGQWLNSMIQDGAEDQARIEAAKTSLKQRKSAKKSKKPKKVKTSRKADFDNRLNEIANQLATMAEKSQATAVNKFVEYDDAPGADRAMKAMIKRIESGEKRTKKSFDSVTSRLNSIDEKLTSPSKTEPTAEFHALESAMRNIVEHIETSEKRSRDALGDMHERMSEMSRRAETADSEVVNKSAPAIAQLEARVADLSAQLDTTNAADKTDTMSYLDERLSGFGEQMDAMRHSNDAMTKRAELSAVDAAKRETREVEQRVATLIGEARNLMLKSVPAAENLTSIKGEIESLNQRFDDIKTEAASDHDVQALRSTIENLTVSVAAGNDTSAFDVMENRLVELTSRLDEAPMPDQMAPQFSDLEDRIHSLDQKLVEAMNQQSDATAFAALESQIGLVADRLASTEESLGHLTTIEQSISQLYTSIEETKDWAQQAADGAATRMADELLEKGMPSAASQGPSPELQALEQGLAAVKQSTQVSEQHNQETLEAVHETLEQIITKLAVIEATPQPVVDVQPAPDLGMPVPQDPHEAAQLPAIGEQSGDLPDAQPNEWADTVQSHLHQDGAGPLAVDPLVLEPVVAPVSEPQIPSLEDAISNQDISPAFNPGPLPQAVETVEPIVENALEAPVELATSEPQAPTEQETGAPLDYIAQARLASQTAGVQSGSDKKKGLGFFTDKILPGNRKDGDAGSEVSSEKKQSKSLFTLPFLSKKKPLTENDEVVAGIVENIETGATNDNGAKDGGRKRLIMAGLILLIAAGGFAYSKFSATSNSQKASAPQPAVSAPQTSGARQNPSAVKNATDKTTPEKTAGEKTSEQTADRAGPVKPVKNISLVIPAKPTNQSMITSAQTGMPVSKALEAGNSQGDRALAAPRDPVLTSSLPPSPPVANHSNINSPLNISTGLAKKAPPAADEPTFSSAQMPPSASGTIELRTAAAKGDPSAQFVIASRYIDGKTMKRDFSKAANWYQKAASSGLAPAQYRLGTLFERGNGLPKDINAARLWYERAAEQGNVKAMHNLAVIYANGQSGQADFGKAKKWFSKAASHGLQDSQYNLAVIHERGLAGKADKPQAFLWYSLAAARGDKDARVKAHSLKNHISASDLKSAKALLASWKPQPPIKAGNFVAIKDPKWRVASRNKAKPKLAAKPSLNGKTLIRTTQNLLSKLGYDVGSPDGVMGSRTANAVRLFQLQNGLSVNGMVSNGLLQQLQARS